MSFYEWSCPVHGDTARFDTGVCCEQATLRDLEYKEPLF